MKMTDLSLILAAAVGGVGLGLVAISGASASEKETTERGACAVKAMPDGTKPTSLTDVELRNRLEAAGYKEVRSLGHEDGCVEAKGLDKEGKRFEVYVHPTTGEIISQR